MPAAASMERQCPTKSTETTDAVSLNVRPDAEIVAAVVAVRDWNPWEIIRHLYDDGISAGIEADWDGGMRVWIVQPKLAEARFLKHEVDLIADWMDHEARRLHPDSSYAIGRRYSDAHSSEFEETAKK